MLKVDQLTGDVASAKFHVAEYSIITLAATGAWDGATLTLQFTPDDANVAYEDAYKEGVTITLTQTDNIKNCEVGGGMWFQLVASGTGASTNLGVWASGNGLYPYAS